MAWLRDGDRNMSFFHKKASARRHKNEILGLLDENDYKLIDLRVVEMIVGNYFTNIFRSSNPNRKQILQVVEAILRRVSKEMNEKPLAIFTKKENFGSFKSMHPSKVLG